MTAGYCDVELKYWLDSTTISGIGPAKIQALFGAFRHAGERLGLLRMAGFVTLGSMHAPAKLGNDVRENF